MGKCYGDIPRGVFVVRGENVVLLGEIDAEKTEPKDIGLTEVSLEEILEKQVNQEFCSVAHFSLSGSSAGREGGGRQDPSESFQGAGSHLHSARRLRGHVLGSAAQPQKKCNRSSKKEIYLWIFSGNTLEIDDGSEEQVFVSSAVK